MFDIDFIARICHNVNKAYCEANGDFSQPTWEEAPEWQRVSARMGVDFHLRGDFSPEDSHVSWMANKIREGWTYGTEKDPEHKKHPCLVPYYQLPKGQQVKDHLFVAIVHSFK